jgi:hypothetical protein
MIKTLRITGVAAVAFAGVVLASLLGPVSLIRLDSSRDEKIGKILDAPGAVDRSRDLHAGTEPGGPDTTPPLVRQAELFKDIIDPKPLIGVVQTEASASPVRTGPPTKPVSTSQKFALLGTAYSPSNPGSSFAYVRFVDNTCQWVPCGSEVGHIVIKEIRESSIVCWDGHRESEQLIEAVPDRVSLLEADGGAPASDPAAASEPLEVKVVEAPPSRPRIPSRSVRPPVMGGTPRLTTDEQESLGDLASRLRRLEGPGADANRAAAVDRLISEFKSSRVSPEETRNLENLGGEMAGEKERGPEGQKREFIRKLNTARPPKD